MDYMLPAAGGASAVQGEMSSNSAAPASFWNRQRKVCFDDQEVAGFVRRVGNDVGGGREFAVVVASDAALRQANTRFRGKRSATDVLSFPDGEHGRLGDVLISAYRAERQAREFGHRVEDELKLLILHGILHLVGYDHETDRGDMHRIEKRWRNKYGLEPSLTERATK
jgi:probable rRNA maturation factor